MGGSAARRSPIFSKQEFFGRGAGRGNASVEHGSILWSLPARRKISRANSTQLASPSHVM